MTDEEGRYRLVELQPGALHAARRARGFRRRGAEGRLHARRTVRAHRLHAPPRGARRRADGRERGGAPVVDTTRTVAGGTVTREELERLPLFIALAARLRLPLGGVTEEPLSTRDAAEDRDATRGHGGARRAAARRGRHVRARGRRGLLEQHHHRRPRQQRRPRRPRTLPTARSTRSKKCRSSPTSSPPSTGARRAGASTCARAPARTACAGRLFYFFRDESLDANTLNNNRRGLKRLPLQQHRRELHRSAAPSSPGSSSTALIRRPRPHVLLRRLRVRHVLDSTLIDALVPVEQNPLVPAPAPDDARGPSLRAEATPPNSPAELAPFVERVRRRCALTVFTARLDHDFSNAQRRVALPTRPLENLRQFGGGSRLADALQGRTRDTDALAYTDNLVLSARAVNQLRAQSRACARDCTERRHAPRRAHHDQRSAHADDRRPFGHARRRLIQLGRDRPRARRACRFRTTLTFVARRAHLQARRRRPARPLHLRRSRGRFRHVQLHERGRLPRRRARALPPALRHRVGAAQHLRRPLRAGRVARRAATSSLTSGLRYERESVFRDRNNFAPASRRSPRPFGHGQDGRSRSASASSSPARFCGLLTTSRSARSVVEFDTNDLPRSAERRAFIAAHLRFPATLAADSSLVRHFGARLTDFSRRLDPNIRIPESYQANVGFERELGRGFVFEANYTFNRGLHLWREFNANAPRLPRGLQGLRRLPSLARLRQLPRRDGRATRLRRFDGGRTRPLHARALADAARTSSRVVEFGVPVSVFNLNSVNLDRRSKPRSPRSHPCGPTLRACKSSSSPRSATASTTASRRGARGSTPREGGGRRLSCARPTRSRA